MYRTGVLVSSLVLSLSLGQISWSAILEAEVLPATQSTCQSLLDIPSPFPRYEFPDRSTVEPNGHLPGADHIPITADTVLQAYSRGVFMYSTDDGIDGWFVGKSDGTGVKRGVLDATDFHAEKQLREIIWRMAKHDAKVPYRITFDQDFEGVITNCQQAPRDNGRVWLVDDVKSSFIELFHRGYAHSVEVWDGNHLIGGTYGIYLNGIFFTESMFTLQPAVVRDPVTGQRLYVLNSSGQRIEGTGRLAVVGLLSYLRAHGIGWTDVQIVSNQSGPMGAKYIPWTDFDQRTEAAKSTEENKNIFSKENGSEIDIIKAITSSHFTSRDALRNPFK